MKPLSASLLTGLILGLTWAVRGRFGHEWGAAWAGAAGALAVLVATGRVDWLRRLPALTALGAIGWGVGGMQSYGIVIGYCRADTLHNAFYGYAMLAVIGGLYGAIGGGLLGLGLESSGEKRPDWFVLVAGMVAGGCLFWGLFIYQLEWLMTPPRSEAWGLSAGAAIALFWYAAREGYHGAVRMGAYSALGGAVGFSVGNFIQTLGALAEISYNWWNVMEFTLGFCGGASMAYAAATSAWPAAATKPSRAANGWALVLVALLIPWANYVNAFESEKIERLAGGLGVEQVEPFVHAQQVRGLVILAGMLTAACWLWRPGVVRDERAWQRLAAVALFAWTLYYVVYGFLVTGVFQQGLPWTETNAMYLPIYLLAFCTWLVGRRAEQRPTVRPASNRLDRTFIFLALAVLIAIAAVSVATVLLHNGAINFHERFPTQASPNSA